MFFVAGWGIFTAKQDIFGCEAAGGGVVGWGRSDGGGFGFSEAGRGVCEDSAC